MTNSIVVTIGFCVKDVEDTIRTATHSIISQDFPHGSIELIVVEGFSQGSNVFYLKKRFFPRSIFNKKYTVIEGLGCSASNRR